MVTITFDPVTLIIGIMIGMIATLTICIWIYASK